MAMAVCVWAFMIPSVWRVVGHACLLYTTSFMRKIKKIEAGKIADLEKNSAACHPSAARSRVFSIKPSAVTIFAPCGWTGGVRERP
jgi:hypothetical protein